MIGMMSHMYRRYSLLGIVFTATAMHGRLAAVMGHGVGTMGSKAQRALVEMVKAIRGNVDVAPSRYV